VNNSFLQIKQLYFEWKTPVDISPYLYSALTYSLFLNSGLQQE